MDEDIDVKLFCTRYVEVMGTESDHVHIVALSDALQVELATANEIKSYYCLFMGDPRASILWTIHTTCHFG